MIDGRGPSLPLTRRALLGSVAGVATLRGVAIEGGQPGSAAIRRPTGDVDWQAVRRLFPLAPDSIQLAAFFLASHPQPVADAIEMFRRKIDADPTWIETAAISDSEGRPFAAVKRALADCTGGAPDEFCLTANTTTALAVAYHGLRIRADQEIVTTEHEHYSHHESIRFAAMRAGNQVRYIALHDEPARASAGEIVDRVARAIGPKTRAVGVTWVYSSTGVKIPVAAIADRVAAANRGRGDADRCLLIVDGVHGFANEDVDIAALGCDFFATGAHKWLCGPRGTGFLWGRREAWRQLTPTVPSFDVDGLITRAAWMNRTPLPPTEAAFMSPGGFIAYEYRLAIPAAVALHRSIGRDRVAARTAALNGAFRDGIASMPGVTLHTPRDPALAGGISCFDVDGLKPAEVAARLAAKGIRTNSAPYRIPYARVSAGIMNQPEDIDAVLRELRSLR